MKKCNFIRLYVLLGAFIIVSGSTYAQNAKSDGAKNYRTTLPGMSMTVDDDNKDDMDFYRWYKNGGKSFQDLMMELRELEYNRGSRLRVYDRRGHAILSLAASLDGREYGGKPYLLFQHTGTPISRAAIIMDNGNLSFSNNTNAQHNKGFSFINGNGIDYPLKKGSNYGNEIMRITNNGKLAIGKISGDPVLDFEIKGKGFTNPSFGISRERGGWDHYYVTNGNFGPIVRAGGAENGIDFQIGMGNAGTFGDSSQAYASKFQIFPNKVETKTREVTLDYGTKDDMVQVSINTNAKVNHSVLTIAGATYIGSNAEKASTGNLDKFDDSYLIDYNLWVEDGIVTEDLAFADVKTWKDDVFEEDYDLISLEEVEKFTKANKHLPDVPSEKEIKATGYTAHQMNMVFMQKIEELTLYTIQLNKRVKELESELTILKSNKKQ